MQKVGVRDASGRFIDTFDLMIQLPWGALTTVVIQHDMTVRQLKAVIEFAVGLPADLLSLGYRRRAALADNDTLRDLRMIPGDRVSANIEYGYEELVAGAVSGNTQKIINDINRHWSDGDVARRRMVVMFIAAHRGYHYLVDRMLADGAPVDAMTPSGRTALHIACAMGNGGCIDTLLQHGANLSLKDANGQTPTQVAFSCGQQESERRLVLYQRAKNRQTRRVNKRDFMQTLPGSSWSRSPRFPVSRLARSVTPTLALQELSLSPAPGPELRVKSLGGASKTLKAARDWSVRRLTMADIDTFSTSSASSVDSDSAGHSNAPQLGEVFDCGDKDDATTPDTSRRTSTTDDTSSIIALALGSSRPRTAPSAIRSPHLLRTTAWQQDTRKVHFETDSITVSPVSPSPQTGMTAIPPLTPPSNNTRTPRSEIGEEQVNSVLSSSTDSSNNRHLNGSDGDPMTSPTQCNSLTEIRLKPRIKSAKPRSQRNNVRNLNNVISVNDVEKEEDRVEDEYEEDVFSDLRRIKDIQAAAEVSVGLRETTEQPFLSNGRRKATPEQNCKAFNDWVESKVQGAKDRKLLNNVQALLDEAFGRADEEMRRKGEEKPKRMGESYEAWKKKKDEEVRTKKKQTAEKQRKAEEAAKLQASIDAENELLIKAWITRKNEMERQKRAQDQREKRTKQRKLLDQQLAAQSAFEKWRLNKEWEELVRLREGIDAFEAKSARSAHLKKENISRLKIRARSAPPTRKNKFHAKTVS